MTLDAETTELLEAVERMLERSRYHIEVYWYNEEAPHEICPEASELDLQMLEDRYKEAEGYKIVVESLR